MKHYTVVFTPRVERQLDRLYAYIAAHGGERRADGYVGAIVAECLSLTTFPERGTKRDDLRLNLRTLGHAGSATIAFSVNASTAIVAIHGVFYGGQDFETALRENDRDD
jgi:toxin ParE1/3/4